MQGDALRLLNYNRGGFSRHTPQIYLTLNHTHFSKFVESLGGQYTGTDQTAHVREKQTSFSGVGAGSELAEYDC